MWCVVLMCMNTCEEWMNVVCAVCSCVLYVLDLYNVFSWMQYCVCKDNIITYIQKCAYVFMYVAQSRTGFVELRQYD